MIELSENLLEIAVLGICLVLSVTRTLRTREKGWLLLSVMYGCYLIGDLYWTLYLIFYGKTPAVFYVSECNWWSNYLFLILLLLYYQTDAERNLYSPILWIIPVFVVSMTVFFMIRGSYLANLIDGILMGILMTRSAQGLLALRGKTDKRKMLFAVTLTFCLIEYSVWISSCFWKGDTIRNSYFWFTVLLIAVQPFFYRAVRKAESG